MMPRVGVPSSRMMKTQPAMAEAGQVLLRPDDTASRAELSIVRSQLVELLARKGRLLAERDGSSVIAFHEQ